MTLLVMREDGSPTSGAAHQTWSIVADSSGRFSTSWPVCDDDCVGHLLVASAVGDVSGTPAGTEFFNHDCGDGVVTSVVPVGGSCSAFTPAVGNGPDNYEVQEGGTYVMTIEGVTECTEDTITVFVQSSGAGNFCFDATGGGGTYVGTFTMPVPACDTMPVSYKCGAGASCSHPGSFGAQGPTSGCGGVHLRTSFFDGNCNKTGDDEDCGSCEPCDLVCPSDTTVDCSESTDPSSTGTPTGCDDATYEDDVTPGPCAGSYVITRTWSAPDTCGGTSTCAQTITVTDTTAPEITCPDDVTIVGCCSEPDIGMATATDDCGEVTITNDAPAEFCLGDTVVTWTAMDDCGNTSTCQQTVTVEDVTLDFEADGLGVAMLHGQSLATVGPEAPFSCVTITGGPDTVSPGNGNNGAAVFDSTNGPFGQDPDLNVGLGMVLYVQANGGQPDAFTGVNGPDTWDHPNDDEDGGTLTFDFCTGVQAKSIDLIDIDTPSPEQGASVVLTDGNGFTRTYTVPAGWTANGPGPAAVGQLLLDAVVPQPGLSSIATVSTQAGYDDTDVVQIQVRFGSSGACDNLRYRPSGPAAAVASRNGSGLNPSILTANGMPVLGTQWSANLDCSSLRNGMATLAVRSAAVAGTLTPAGESLIGGELVYRSAAPYARGASQLRWSIPFDLSLVGLELHVQGMCLETGGIGPKIRQNRARLSNALDLTLGF